MGGQTTEGGAIFFGSDGDPQEQSLTNATISANSATGAITNVGGNLFVQEDDTVVFENTLVSAGAADPGSENCGAVGALSSHGHNIDSRDQCSFHRAGDRVNTSPLLAALAANGGPVVTIALKPGSPAIDAGAAAGCPTTDARGALRPAGRGCDIGAFEIGTGIASNPGLSSGTAFFQYGTTTAYGKSTPAQRVRATTAHSRLSAPLAGLSPATRYHFRIVVMNATGSVHGADQTFTTTGSSGMPPPRGSED